MDHEIVSATEREAELARQLDQERKKASQISRALFELEVQLAASQSQLEESQAAHDRLRAELARVTYEKAQAVASRVHMEGLLKSKDTSKDGKIRQLEDALSYAAKLNDYGKGSKTDTRTTTSDFAGNSSLSALTAAQPKTSDHRKNKKNNKRRIRKAGRPRVVACTVCYVNKLPCDGKTPCSSCATRDKSEGQCKRVKCQHFESGSCDKMTCTLAHEEDHYPNVVPFTKLKRNGMLSLSSLEDKDDGERHRGKKRKSWEFEGDEDDDSGENIAPPKKRAEFDDVDNADGSMKNTASPKKRSRLDNDAEDDQSVEDMEPPKKRTPFDIYEDEGDSDNLESAAPPKKKGKRDDDDDNEDDDSQGDMAPA